MDENLSEPIKLLNSSKISNYTFEDGLASNHVYAISQDSLGYIWVATEAGLSRFNGKEFYNFTTKNGLKRNEIVDLVRTKEKRIWMAYDDSLGYIENGGINSFDVDIKQKLSWNYSVYEKKDSLWISFGKYFYLVDKNTKAVKSLNENLSSENSIIILNNYNNQVFVYSPDTIFCFKKDSLVSKIPLTLNSSKSYRIMSANYRKGVFCIAKEQLFFFDFVTKKVRTYYDVDVTDAQDLKQFDNELIITNTLGGLKAIHIKENMDLVEGAKTNADIIYTDVFRDRDLNFWLGTSTKGVIFLPKISEQIESKSVIDNIKLSELNCLFVDSNDTWIGTRKGQLILINNDKEQVKTLPFKNPNGKTRINDIVKLNSGKLLVSSDAGLYFFEKNEFRHVFYTALKKISVVGKNIYLNTYKNIISTNEECLTKMLYKYKDKPKKYIGDLIKENECLKQINSNRSHQTLFIGNKVFVYEPNTGFVSYIISNDKLVGRKIIQKRVDIKDMYHYNKYIFIATSGEGILNYNLQTEEIKPIKGLNSTIIYSLDVDLTNDIMYASSNAGVNIIKLNDEGIEDYVVAITQNDGLQSQEIKDVILADTTIIAISDKGINYIDKDFKIDKKLPNFKIEQFVVNNIELPIKTSYKLKTDENNIAIKFNKIDFNNKIKTRFVYQKDGGNWRETNNNTLNFDNLEHGEHKIKLGLVLSQNEIPRKTEELTFHIEPKFHQTNWAKIIAALAVLVILFLAHVYLLSRQNLRVLENLVVNRTQQLNFKMRELDEVNNDLRNKNENLNSYTYLVSHDLKAPLYNISSFLEIISTKNKNYFDFKDKEYLGYINHSLQGMINKINDLLAFSKVANNVDLKLIKPINLNKIIDDVLIDFKFEIEKKEVQFKIDSQLPDIKIEKTSANLLFQNLISNSIKYNKSCPPLIEISTEQNSIRTTIHIKDNGIGIRKNYQAEAFDIFSRGHDNEEYEGTGIGLAICKKIVEAHNADIKLKSEKNKGTVLSLIFPNVN